MQANENPKRSLRQYFCQMLPHWLRYANDRLLWESFGSNTLDFFYDSNGNAYALKYNGILYYYITNLQGDVMSIVDAQGAVVASYEYAPYGNLISDEPAENTVGHLNPLRYRGYYYDSESELYYLQSRYYDPELGRFLNADAFASTGQGLLGNNMFAYCLNNPVNLIDATGLRPSWNDIKGHGQDTIEEIIDYWDRHANRNDEQEDYLEELQQQCGGEKAMLDYIEMHWNAQPWHLNIFHMNIFSAQGFDALSNVKYLSPDGRYEVIICNPGTDAAYIVTSSVNKGTLNYSTDGGWGHTWQDVVPYFVFGNNGYGLIGDFFADMEDSINCLRGS